MMRRMIVAVHVWCLQMRIEPVCELAFTFSLRLHTGPPSTSLITDWAKLFDWSAVTNCFTWIIVWENSLLHCLRKMQNATRKYWLHCLRKMQNATRRYLWKQFERIIWAKPSDKLFENGLRQGYEEMFSTRLVTNYFQWIRSTLWQMFHWSKLRRISTGNFWSHRLVDSSFNWLE